MLSPSATIGRVGDEAGASATAGPGGAGADAGGTPAPVDACRAGCSAAWGARGAPAAAARPAGEAGPEDGASRCAAVLATVPSAHPATARTATAPTIYRSRDMGWSDCGMTSPRRPDRVRETGSGRAGLSAVGDVVGAGIELVPPRQVGAERPQLDPLRAPVGAHLDEPDLVRRGHHPELEALLQAVDLVRGGMRRQRRRQPVMAAQQPHLVDHPVDAEPAARGRTAQLEPGVEGAAPGEHVAVAAMDVEAADQVVDLPAHLAPHPDDHRLARGEGVVTGAVGADQLDVGDAHLAAPPATVVLLDGGGLLGMLLAGGGVGLVALADHAPVDRAHVPRRALGHHPTVVEEECVVAVQLRRSEV